jgi:LAS superfamily LD-carboxypeptidase LdcB
MISGGSSRLHQQKLSQIQNARRKAQEVALQPRGGGGGRSSTAPRGGFTGAGSGGIHGLTPQAGAAFQRLNAAYKDRWGQPLTVNSGGRTGEQQQRLRNLYLAGKGNLAAPRGQSVHESGRAVDLGGAAHYSSTPQHAWLRANAGSFGWLWTGKNFSQREDWHWEFAG